MADAPIDPMTIGVVDRIRARQRFSVPYFSDPQNQAEQIRNEWMQQADHDVAQLLLLLRQAEGRADEAEAKLRRVLDQVDEWKTSAARPLHNTLLDAEQLHADQIEHAIRGES